MSSNDRPTSRRDFLVGGVAVTPLALTAIALTPVATTAANGAVLPESAPAVGQPAGSAPAPDHPATTDYRPAFFTPDEWAFINAACARLIPADEHGPSAVELGVPQYIDRQMGTPWAEGGIWYMQGPFVEAAAEFGYQSQLTPRQQYRLGIAAIDRLCRERLQQPFAALTPAQQDDVLKQLEKGSLTSADLPLKTFFSAFLLKNVMEGYFGDPMYGGNKDMASWKIIGYPGVRGDYLEWVGDAKPYPYGPVSIHGKRG